MFLIDVILLVVFRYKWYFTLVGPVTEHVCSGICQHENNDRTCSRDGRRASVSRGFSSSTWEFAASSWSRRCGCGGK